MTRKRMMAAVRESLDDKELTCENCRPVAEASVDATLDYLLEFAQSVAQELVVVGLFSEAMVAGVLVRKMKSLKHD